jgi:hypothetical protein
MTRPAEAIWRVISISSLLGSGLPLGWLWATRTEAPRRSIASARVDDAGIERAAGELRLGDYAVVGVEYEDHKDLVLQVAEPGSKDPGRILGGADVDPLAVPLPLHPPSDLERGQYLRSLCFADTPDTHQFLRVPAGDGPQGPLRAQDPPGKVKRRRVPGACPDDQRQQFRIGQYGRPAIEHLLPGSFAGRPGADGTPGIDRWAIISPAALHPSPLPAGDQR